MKTALDPKIDFQMTTISRIVRDRSGRRHPEYTGGAPKRHDFVTYKDRKCLMLGSNFQVVLRDAWMDGMPANTQDEWVHELLDRVDLFPFAGPDQYVLDLEVAYTFVKTHHPRSSIKRFWETLDWSKAPRLGGCLIDTIQRILTTLPQNPSYAVLSDKLGWGDILRLDGGRVMALDTDADSSLTGAWGGWEETPVRLLTNSMTSDDKAYRLLNSLPLVFPTDGFGNHGVFSYFDTYVIDLDAAYDAVMEAQPWAKIERVWDAWDWSKAQRQPLAPSTDDPISRMVSNIDAAISDVKDMTTMTQVFLDPSLQTVCIDEAEKLRRENAALRDQVRQLRHTYEAPMLRREAPKVDITLDVSAGLSPACLTLLMESLTEMARTVLLLREGHDTAPIVTRKINVP